MAGGHLTLTVAICTWNRCRSLQQTLHGLTRVSPPSGAAWEAVIVNNNCTDDTDAVIESFAGRLPVRRALEPTPGLSHARNRAVAEAAGDYIIWTDDDVTVSRDWLAAYAEAFRARPEAAIFGGPIRPAFDGSPPAWMARIYPSVAGVYAARDFGAEAVPLSPHAIPWGANYALRLEEQRRHPYNPDLGYRPGRLIGWEETEVIQALLAEGATGWWVPAASLQHHVPRARQTTKYLRTHFYNRGVYYGSRSEETAARLILGRPRWLWRQAVTAEMKYRVHRVVSRPEVWVEHLIASSESWGLLNGYAQRAGS